jgi:hypothetical protein
MPLEYEIPDLPEESKPQGSIDTVEEFWNAVMEWTEELKTFVNLIMRKTSSFTLIKQLIFEKNFFNLFWEYM